MGSSNRKIVLGMAAAAALTWTLTVGANADHHEGESELEGIVDSQTGSCPNITIRVAGTSITADDKTRYEDGSCTDVSRGRKVEIKGTADASGTIRARKIDLDD